MERIAYALDIKNHDRPSHPPWRITYRHKDAKVQKQYGGGADFESLIKCQLLLNEYITYKHKTGIQLQEMICTSTKIYWGGAFHINKKKKDNVYMPRKCALKLWEDDIAYFTWFN